MNIPKILIAANNISGTAADAIIKASRKPCSLGDQMIMANYYGYMKSKAEAAVADFTKINLLK